MITSKQIGKALEMAHFISTKSDDDIFVGYAPHVNWLDVTIHEGGYSKKNRTPLKPNKDVNGTIDLKDDELFESVFATLETMCDEIMQGE